MGDQVCEIEEIEEEIEHHHHHHHHHGKVNNHNSPDFNFSNGGPHHLPLPSSRDVSPTLAQNGGDKIEDQQNRHRKSKEGSGGLPLYLFLQESVASESGRKVDPKCPNASNPYHLCTDYCRAKLSEIRRDDIGPKSPFSFLSRHSRSSSSDGSFRDSSKVDPRCPNSSNPYHECTDSCRSKLRQTERAINGTKSAFPFTSHSAPTSSGSSIDGRKVDPRCPNSANPYHECTENCQSKLSQSDKDEKHRASFRLFSPRNSRTSSGNGSGRLGDNSKVDPRCANASNPYHECTDQCFKKLQGGNHIHTVPSTPGPSTPRKSKGKNVQSMEREGIHPGCINASNPYHKCNDSCFEKMQT